MVTVTKMRPGWEKRSLNAQAKVMHNYRKKGVVRSDQEEQALHTFFSPFRVPRRITRSQAEFFILASPLSAQRGVNVLGTDLSGGGRMSNRRFKSGIQKYLVKVTLIIVLPAVKELLEV